jgi:hypothetical protein
MLFLYRPRQTWMPYRLPRERTQQNAYNRQLQEAYAATRRTAPSAPAADAAVAAAAAAQARDPISDLKDLARLHEAGLLSDAEFTAAKARVIGAEEHGS